MFYVGQKVVCVDNSFDGDIMPGEIPAVGAVYTIASVRYFGINECPSPGYGVTLAEISARETDEHYAEYEATRFRPLTDQKKSVSFTIGADPDSEHWDNRRKIVEPAKVEGKV